MKFGAGSPYAADQVRLSVFQIGNRYPGGFQGDEYVGGNDFLTWQHIDGWPSGLTAWQNNYGAPAPAISEVSAIPESGSAVLCFIAATVAAIVGRWRRQESPC